MKKSVIILFITLLVWGSGFSWGACTESRKNCGASWTQKCSVWSNPPVCYNNGAFGLCQDGYVYYTCEIASTFTKSYVKDIGSCNGTSVPYTLVTCANQTERDSSQCVNVGKQWVNGDCKESGCTAEDSTNIQQLKQKCQQRGGTDDFELVDNGANGCGLSGFCDLCNGTAYKRVVDALKKRCCELGHLPDSVTCAVVDASSAIKEFNLSSVECSPAKPQVTISANGEVYRDGCDEPPSDDTTGTSSSDSQEISSSSESGGSDSLGLDWLKDSTHKIINYDSTTAANTLDLVNYLYDIKTCLEAGTCGNGEPIDYNDSLHAIKDTLHHSNELLKQIADKDLSVQVNGGLTAEKQAELVSNIQNVADSAAKYGNANGEKLDSIVSALKGIGMDSVAHKLDSMRNDKLDSISGGIYSLDSTFAYWGDSSNWKVDSAGWGGKYDSLKDWGDSLTGAMGDWLEGCDTTGGKHCDNIYIGSHGLDSAASGMKGTAGALRDSMLNGRFADSLNLWASKFNNPKITGSGSNTCPSALTRSYSLNFGSMGEVQMGSFGTYLCEPIFGSVTPWTLGRILLRAIVAISCMWFLFKCATGFKGDSGEED